MSVDPVVSAHMSSSVVTASTVRNGAWLSPKKARAAQLEKNLSSHPRNRVGVSASSRTQVLAETLCQNMNVLIGILALSAFAIVERVPVKVWLRRTNRELNISETAETKEEVMVTETRTNNVRPRELARG